MANDLAAFPDRLVVDQVWPVFCREAGHLDRNRAVPVSGSLFGFLLRKPLFAKESSRLVQLHCKA